MHNSPDISSMRGIYFLAVFPLILGSCSLTKKEDKIDVSNVVIPDADHEYFEIEHMFINWSDILNQNKKTYYIYIYSLTCSHCKELKNWIIEKALNRNDIYFVKGSNKDIIEMDVSKTIGATNIENIAILGYPTVLKIQDKTLVKNVAGNSNIIDILNT